METAHKHSKIARLLAEHPELAAALILLAAIEPARYKPIPAPFP